MERSSHFYGKSSLHFDFFNAVTKRKSILKRWSAAHKFIIAVP